MPTFEYVPISNTPAGPATIEAVDRAAALRTLRARGITPAKLRALDADAPSGKPIAMPAPRLTSGISRAAFASFIRELATATGAGLTIVQALRTMGRQRKGGRELDMINHLLDQVEHGRSLADAADSWGTPFDEMTVNLIRAGEASGRLEEVLDQSALLLDRQIELRRALVGATIYPLILLVLGAVGVVVVVAVVVPRVLEPLKGQLSEEDLPLPTRVVQGVADVVGGHYITIAIATAVIVLVVRRALAEPAIRLAVDRALLALPVAGRLVRDVAVARFTRTLATLIDSGLPALNALRITRATLGNKALEQEIENVCDAVAGGQTIADPLEECGQFPPLLVQIVGVGERSGRLAPMLRQAADAFERKTQASIKLFTTVLPPLLIVLLAIVVGFVIAAVLLPLLDLQEAIG